MSYQVEQLKIDGTICLDFDFRHNDDELKQIFVTNSKIIESSKGKNLFNISGKEYRLIFKNIVYSGNPHPIRKKRVQVDSNSLKYLQDIDTLLIGIYNYKGNTIFSIFNSSRFIGRQTKTYTSAHIEINDLKEALINGQFINKRYDVLSNSLNLTENLKEILMSNREKQQTTQKERDISLGVGVMRTWFALSYREWNALAEYVDNSIGSFIEHESILKQVGCNEFSIDINIKETEITIKDNAGGISDENIDRAFDIAIPPKVIGLSEFGMGMKTASTWFSHFWEVETSAIKEKTIKKFTFDVLKMLDQNELKASEFTEQDDENLDKHYTKVTLTDLRHLPKGKTLEKVKRHLASIYRNFIDENNDNFINVRININGKPLIFDRPKILIAPPVNDSMAKDIEWKQDITINIDDISAVGFIGIMSPMSASRSGFALFKNGRVIQGSASKDEGYRPNQIFSSNGSHPYKCLFGELHIQGVGVTHLKDAFDFGEYEEQLLEELKKYLKKNPISESTNILYQASKYRIPDDPDAIRRRAVAIVNDIAPHIAENVPKEMENIDHMDQSITEIHYKEDESLIKDIEIPYNGKNWQVRFEFIDDSSVTDLIQVNNEDKNLGVKLCLKHPFMQSFVDEKSLEMIWRIAVAMCIAEISASKSKQPPREVRKKMNILLNGFLSKG